MEQQDVHALTAAYALDALDDAEEREYEAHLRGCERCREELAELTETATALAYAVDGPEPPPALRERILESARAEQATVVPLRPRRRLPIALGGLAAAAAVLAVAFGLWASSLSDQLDREQLTNEIISDPSARSIPIEGADGRLIVSDSGGAVLVVSGLEGAPSGKTYQLWVAEGDRPEPAGLFDGSDDRDVVRVGERVPPGASVLVTLEDEGGAEQPTSTPIFGATT